MGREKAKRLRAWVSLLFFSSVFPGFHPSFYQPFLLIPHVFFSFLLCVPMFSLDFPVKFFPLLSYQVSPEQISLTLSSHVQLSISEDSQPSLMTPYHFLQKFMTTASVRPASPFLFTFLYFLPELPGYLGQATSYRYLVFRPCNLYFWAKLWGEKIMNSW